MISFTASCVFIFLIIPLCHFYNLEKEKYFKSHLVPTAFSRTWCVTEPDNEPNTRPLSRLTLSPSAVVSGDAAFLRDQKLPSTPELYLRRSPENGVPSDQGPGGVAATRREAEVPHGWAWSCTVAKL